MPRTKSHGRGWYDDSEEHRRMAKEHSTKSYSWWPLLFIPLAFFVGMGVDRAASNNPSIQSQQNYNAQPGVGGGPGTVCPSPGSYLGP